MSYGIFGTYFYLKILVVFLRFRRNWASGVCLSALGERGSGSGLPIGVSGSLCVEETWAGVGVQ